MSTNPDLENNHLPPEPIPVNPADATDTRRVIPSANRGLTIRLAQQNAAREARLKTRQTKKG